MSHRALRVAILGCGPWGLGVFERPHATAAHAAGRLKLAVHVVEPGPPGVGVYRPELPEYLLLNTACGQIDLYASKLLNPTLKLSLPRPSFYEWLVAEGYRVRESVLRAEDDETARPVRPADFVPRCWLGRYLQSVFQSLAGSLPNNLSLKLHAQRAVRVDTTQHRERVLLQDGTRLDVDYAFLTLGHGESPAEQSQPRQLDGCGTARPLDVAELNPSATMAISGFGLTAIDTIAHVTLGTGGRFVRAKSGVRYLPSGREPRLVQFSRSGTPYRTRPRGTGEVERGIEETLLDARAVCRRAPAAGSRDFRQKILPFVLREMTARFHARSVVVSDSPEDSFDPAFELFGGLSTFPDATAYENFLTQAVLRDLAASHRGTARSPLKAGIESLRGLRELIRELVDFGGLTSESFADFRQNFVPRVYRLIVGPPIQKMEEWLALRRAGLLGTPLGPRPRVERRPHGWVLGSSLLGRAVTIEASQLLSGFAPPAHQVVQGSALLRGLLATGRARLLDPSGRLNCGLELDGAFHPVGRAGIARRLFVLGLLSEGARSFNLYVPSPGSRFRAFADMQRCIDELIAQPIASVSVPVAS